MLSDNRSDDTTAFNRYVYATLASRTMGMAHVMEINVAEGNVAESWRVLNEEYNLQTVHSSRGNLVKILAFKTVMKLTELNPKGRRDTTTHTRSKHRCRHITSEAVRRTLQRQ